MLRKTEKLTLLEVLLIPKVLPQEERFIVISKFSICQAELYSQYEELMLIKILTGSPDALSKL